jgi:hypothetical protein
MKVNVDADWALFRGCFACEKSIYTIKTLAGNTKFDSRKELDEYLKKTPHEDGMYEIIKESDLQPLAYALGTIRSMLSLICERFGTRSPVLYLSGPNNFRYNLAKSYPYKGNREKTQRPHWSKEATEYLCNQWGAQIVDGMEADDALGISQTDTSILVSPDKDLDQIPGWHYNPTKEEKYYVDDFTAEYNFWKQMLTGDTTDNIFGIPNVGAVRAAALLDGFTSVTQLRQRVWDMYQEKFEEKAADRFNENYGLLRILRSPDELERIRNTK